MLTVNQAGAQIWPTDLFLHRPWARTIEESPFGASFQDTSIFSEVYA